MVETIYGNIDSTSLYIYYEQLKNRTFSLLLTYETQPFDNYQKKVKDLLVSVISFENIKLQKHKKFCEYVEMLTSVIEPQPYKSETEHNFVRRHILDAVNLIDRMFIDVGGELDEHK